MAPSFPPGVSPIKKARESVGDVHYYPAKKIEVITLDHHRYYLILWRDAPRHAQEIGHLLKATYPYLRYATREIVFYRDPSNPSASKNVKRYGLYMRKEQ